jgi:hypothetical protein
VKYEKRTMRTSEEEIDKREKTVGIREKRRKSRKREWKIKEEATRKEKLINGRTIDKSTKRNRGSRREGNKQIME